MANEDIKSSIKEAKLAYWKIAKILGISENTFGRKLRVELTEEEKDKIFKLIEKHKK